MASAPNSILSGASCDSSLSAYALSLRLKKPRSLAGNFLQRRSSECLAVELKIYARNSAKLLPRQWRHSAHIMWLFATVGGLSRKKYIVSQPNPAIGVFIITGRLFQYNRYCGCGLCSPFCLGRNGCFLWLIHLHKKVYLVFHSLALILGRVCGGNEAKRPEVSFAFVHQNE